jgi:hypothetical protein
MVSVWMMQVAVHQIVFMATMRYAIVSTVRAMRVRSAVLLRSAALGVCSSRADSMIVYMIAMLIMHVSIVQVIRVPVMLYRRMSAIRAMLMGVPFMSSAGFRACIGHG